MRAVGTSSTKIEGADSKVVAGFTLRYHPSVRDMILIEHPGTWGRDNKADWVPPLVGHNGLLEKVANAVTAAGGKGVCLNLLTKRDDGKVVVKGAFLK